ncbi:hypothetical protein JCM10296v2_001806 [Rhodotorula toruloides]
MQADSIAARTRARATVGGETGDGQKEESRDAEGIGGHAAAAGGTTGARKSMEAPHASSAATKAPPTPTTPSTTPSPHPDPNEPLSGQNLLEELKALWSGLPDDDVRKMFDFFDSIRGKEFAEQQRQLQEAVHDQAFAASLRDFEANPDNWQNLLGRPGGIINLLKHLIAPAGPPTPDRPHLFPAVHFRFVALPPRAIMTKLRNDTVGAGKRIVKLIQTPTSPHAFLTDLLLTWEGAFRAGTHLFLGMGVRAAQRVLPLLIACMRMAEKLGGKILPYFLTEHERRLTDHEKIEWGIDLVSGAADIGIMSANAGNRGMGQEAQHAEDPSEAPKSLESLFQGQFDARDESSHFWRHLKVLEDGMTARRAAGAIIMPTDALFETWLNKPEPTAMFDEAEFRLEESMKRAQKAATTRNKLNDRTKKKKAADAHRLQRERVAYASAATADDTVREAAKQPVDQALPEAIRKLTDEEIARAEALKTDLQHEVDVVLSEHSQAYAALQKVDKMKRKVRKEVAQAIPLPVGKDPKEAPAHQRPYRSKLQRVIVSPRRKSVRALVAAKTAPEEFEEDDDGFVDEPDDEKLTPPQGQMIADVTEHAENADHAEHAEHADHADHAEHADHAKHAAEVPETMAPQDAPSADVDRETTSSAEPVTGDSHDSIIHDEVGEPLADAPFEAVDLNQPIAALADRREYECRVGDAFTSCSAGP